MQVHSVRLRRDRIVVALEHKVLVYNFADLRLLHSIETLSNPTGIIALSAAAEQTILACPGLHAGQVCVHALSLSVDFDTRQYTHAQFPQAFPSGRSTRFCASRHSTAEPSQLVDMPEPLLYTCCSVTSQIASSY